MDVSRIITNINTKLTWTKFINDLEERGFKKHKRLGYFLENQSNLGEDMLINNVIEGGAIKDTSLLHLIPYIIFRPLDETQLFNIVTLSNQYSIPISFAGGKTGLSGAYANFGVIVDLTDLRSSEKPISIDLEKQLVRVEQRVLLSDLIKNIPILSKGKYIFPIQPASAFKLPVRIGGIISTDASGVTSGKLGSALDWLISMRIMTPEGKVVNLSRDNQTFYKIIGGNGYFGIVLDAVFKLYQPEENLKQAIIFGVFKYILISSTLLRLAGSSIRTLIVSFSFERGSHRFFFK